MSVPVKISLTILIITLMGVGIVGAYQFLASTIDSTDYLSKGDEYFQAGKYSSALSSYQKALDKKGDASLYLKIAKIYEIKNQYNDAVNTLKQGSQRYSDSAELNYQIGEDASKLIPLDKNNIDVAVSAYDKSATSDKFKNIGKYKEARLLSTKADKADLDKAKEIYISLDFAPAKYELVLFELDDPDKALNLLDTASQSPSNLEYDALVPEFSTWAEFSKTLKEQLTNLKTDITNNKSKATILNSKGFVAYKVNRCEFGIDDLKSAITESEKDVFYPEARIILGECLKRLSNYDEAKSYVLPVYEQQKDNIDARLVLRQIYKGLKDKDNMKKIYDELITLDGRDIQIRQDYANDSEYLSDWQTAAEQYAWLGKNLTDSTVIQNKLNKDLSWNQKFLIKSYDLYMYKNNDYKDAENLISDSLKINSKFIDANIAADLTAWSKYMQNPKDENLRNDAYDKAKDLETANAYYHAAEILQSRGEIISSKEKALLAYDKDENGYVAEKAANLVKELEK